MKNARKKTNKKINIEDPIHNITTPPSISNSQEECLSSKTKAFMALAIGIISSIAADRLGCLRNFGSSCILKESLFCEHTAQELLLNREQSPNLQTPIFYQGEPLSFEKKDAILKEFSNIGCKAVISDSNLISNHCKNYAVSQCKHSEIVVAVEIILLEKNNCLV